MPDDRFKNRAGLWVLAGFLTKILLIIKIIKIIIYSILSFFSLKVPVYPLLRPTATPLKFFVY